MKFKAGQKVWMITHDYEVIEDRVLNDFADENHKFFRSKKKAEKRLFKIKNKWKELMEESRFWKGLYKEYFDRW